MVGGWGRPRGPAAKRVPDTKQLGSLERGRCSWGRQGLGWAWGCPGARRSSMDALWAEASMAAEPPGGSHHGDSSGGTAGRQASEELGECSLKICLSRPSQGTVRCRGGVGASELWRWSRRWQKLRPPSWARSAPSVWQPDMDREVAGPTVSTALGSSAEL